MHAKIFILAVLFVSSAAALGDVEMLKLEKIIAIQQSQLTVLKSQVEDLRKVVTKEGEYKTREGKVIIDAQGAWQGTPGPKGDRGTDGTNGSPGPMGTNNIKGRIICTSTAAYSMLQCCRAQFPGAFLGVWDGEQSSATANGVICFGN